MGHFQFFKQKKFLVNLIAILVLCIILLWLTFRLLNRYTRHNQVFTMPSFIGMDYHEMEHDYAKDFHFILIDSIYPKGQVPGSVVQQDPLPGSKIKKGRNVYYIIVAETPEKTTMPNLKNLSLRQAIGQLDAHGLEVDRLVYKDYFAKNAVIEQYFNGQPISPETEIVKGSKIVLHVGLGEDKMKTKVPNLIGKPASEAARLLHLAGMNLGQEHFEDVDSLQYMRVSRMSPGPSSGLVEPGTPIQLWYHSSNKFDFDKELKHLMEEDSISNTPSAIENDTIQEETIETTDYEYEDEF